MNYSTSSILLLAGAFFTASSAFAQTEKVKVTTYIESHESDVESIPLLFRSLSDNGKWACGGNYDCEYPYLWNLETDEVTCLLQPLEIEEGIVAMAYDVSDDGVVVGEYNGKAAYYEEGEWHTLNGYYEGGAYLTFITPDGSYMGGRNISSSGTLAKGLLFKDKKRITVTLPKQNFYGNNATMFCFTGISNDGKYLSGCMDWNLSPASTPFLATYKEGQYEATTFADSKYITTDEQGNPQYTYYEMRDDMRVSPDGKYVFGCSYGETESTSIYDIEKDVFTEMDCEGTGAYAIDSEGTLYGHAPISDPIREVYVKAVDDENWYTLEDLLKLAYDDFNFTAETGYSSTGTMIGCSWDGRRLVGMEFLTGSTNYALDLPYTIKTAIAKLKGETGSSSLLDEARVVGAFLRGNTLHFVGDVTRVSICNMMGAVAIEERAVKGKELNVSDLSEGFYVVRMENATGKKATSKIYIK